MASSSVFHSLFSNMNLDVFSIILGFTVGVALVMPINWLRPRLMKRGHQVNTWFASKREDIQTGFEEKYKSELSAYLRYQHLGPENAGLTEIFVEPRIIIPQSTVQKNEDEPATASQLYDFWPELAAEIALPHPPSITLRKFLQRAARVVVSGQAGTGKSMLLAYIADLYSHQTLPGSYSFIADKLPVFLHLAELKDAFENMHEPVPGEEVYDPLEPLSSSLSSRFNNLSSSKLRQLILAKAQLGNLMLLIDGWDELPPRDCSTPFRNWMEQLLDEYPDCQVIVAGPTEGYGSLATLGFIITGLLPWRKGQADAIGQLWSTAVGNKDPFSSDIYWYPGQLRFETNIRLSLLYANDEDVGIGSLPDRKVELMEAALLHILTRVRSKAIDEWLTPAARELWQVLAFTLIQDGELSLPKDQILQLAETIVEPLHVSAEMEDAIKLYDTLEASGLFIVYSGGNAGFLCPAWRDYLAACYLAQSDKRAFAAKHFDDPIWAAAIGYFVGRIGAIPILKELHQQERILEQEDLFVLAEWLPEALDRHQWRRKVLIGLGQIVIDKNNPIAWRQRATATLARTGENGVTDLLNQLLGQPESSMRQIALAATARISPREAILLNERMIDDGEDQVRIAAVHSLAWIDDVATEQPMIEALLEPDEKMKAAAAEGLALNGTTVAKEILAEAIRENSMAVRKAAVHGLSLLEDEWAIELLKEVVETDNQRLVQSAAETALKTLHNGNEIERWQPQRAGEQEWLVNWAVSRGMVVPVGPAAFPILLKAMDDEDERIRTAAVTTLASLGGQEALKPLEKARADTDPGVRAMAEYAIGRLDRAWGPNRNKLG